MTGSSIMRRSIHIFLKDYQHFTLAAVFLAFPFSAALLFSQILIPQSSLFWIIRLRTQLLFAAVGFPSSSKVFALLNLKLSQTVSSYIVTFPFSLSSLILSKALVIQIFRKQSRETHKALVKPMLLTHLFNSFLLLSLNAAVFCILVFTYNILRSFNALSSFFASTAVIGGILYSVFLTRALAVCNVALAISGTERRGGLVPIIKACILLRRRASAAISLVLPTRAAMTAVEALFHFRITNVLTTAVLIEAVIIAYFYTILLVIDSIVSCTFYNASSFTLPIKRAHVQRRQNQKWRLLYRQPWIESNGPNSI